MNRVGEKRCMWPVAKKPGGEEARGPMGNGSRGLCDKQKSEILPRKAYYGGEGGDKDESFNTALGHSPCPISSDLEAGYLELQCRDTGGGLVGRTRYLGFEVG